MDITGLVIVLPSVAIGVFQCFGTVEELQPLLLAHGQQCHVEVVDLGLVHVGVVGMVRGHRRHRVDDDVGVGVALLDGIHQRRVVGNIILHAHAGIVGAQHDDHPAGLHLCHGLRKGVGILVFFKGHDGIMERRMGADALLGAELLQAEQAVGIQAHRVGIAKKQRIVLVAVACICRLLQQSIGGLVDLVVVRDVVLALHQFLMARVLHIRRRGFAAPQQHQRDAHCQQDRQCADGAHQHRLFLHGGHGSIFRLRIVFHSYHPSLFRSGVFSVSSCPFRI